MTLIIKKILIIISWVITLTPNGSSCYSSLSLNYNSTQYSIWSNYFGSRLSRDLDDSTLTKMFINKCGSKPNTCPSPGGASRVNNFMSFPKVTEPLLCGRSAIDTAVTLNFDPCRDTGSIAQQKAYYLYTIYQSQLKGSFEEQYRSKCLNAINLESFSVTHPITEYHYTLYYYDQAGNLVKTVPPAGVNPDFSDTWQKQVAAARASKQPLPRPHTMVTTYRYVFM